MYRDYKLFHTLMKFSGFILLLFINLSLSAQIITTYAGNGTYGNSGNGGPATAAQLAWPYGVATDNSGNVYIADHDNNLIRKVNTAGIITTFAGTGTLGYSGDGGPAIAANLYHPGTITTDNTGNIYFTDQNGDVIRKINTAGIITSITGNLPTGYSGDGGPLMLAQFAGISAISFDNTGNLYIADFDNSVIRKVNTSNIINTVAGNGTAGFSGDGGPATSAQLDGPYGVVIQPSGNMLIPDARNNRIRSVNTAGIITTIAGTGAGGYTGDGGPAIAAKLHWPWHNAQDAAGNYYFADGLNQVVRKIDNSGIITTYAGNGISGYSGDGGPATSAQMIDVCGVACDITGNIFIVNRTFPNVVRKVTNCLAATVTLQPADVTLCNSGNAVFSITASNANSYQWQENTGSGWNNLVNNLTYSGTSTPDLNITGVNTTMNGFQYRCIVTNSCGNTYSLTATLIVNIPSTPVINIATATTTICTGTNTTFTATISNGGSSPVYQWKKNGLPVGSNSNTFIDNTLINGDIISCQLTSNSSCLITNVATSNNIVMVVNPVLTPSINISASQNNFCYGTPVTFTSVNTNQGISPVFQWKKNGLNVGSNLSTYNDNTLLNGDIVSCVLTSSIICVTSNQTTSNPIIMMVTPLVTPTIMINANKTSFCIGESATFTAIPTNGGPTPFFQWKKNGAPVGSNTIAYTGNTFLNGDLITCSLTSNASCLLTPTVSSNSISITITPDPIVSLNKTSGICSGANKILDAGIFNSYLWSDGSTNRTLTISTPGTYYVTVTDNNGCIGSDTTILTTLFPLPKNFLPSDSAVCSYESILIKANPGYLNYLWSNGFTGTNFNVSIPGIYWLEVTDNNQCKGRDSIIILPKECIKEVYVPSSFTPNNDGKNDIIRPVFFGNILNLKFTIYNRYGQLIYQTTELNKGWDGSRNGSRIASSVFVWTCSYQFAGRFPEFEKGTFLLLR